jgi:hypothetical protein
MQEDLLQLFGGFGTLDLWNPAKNETQPKPSTRWAESTRCLDHLLAKPSDERMEQRAEVVIEVIPPGSRMFPYQELKRKTELSVAASVPEDLFLTHTAAFLPVHSGV